MGGNRETGCQPILMEAMSGPGAAEPCAAVPLDAVELAAGMERSQIELASLTR